MKTWRLSIQILTSHLQLEIMHNKLITHSLSLSPLPSFTFISFSVSYPHHLSSTFPIKNYSSLLLSYPVSLPPLHPTHSSSSSEHALSFGIPSFRLVGKIMFYPRDISRFQNYIYLNMTVGVGNLAGVREQSSSSSLSSLIIPQP